MLKFKWCFRYVDEGVMEPDDLNRWAVDGYILADLEKCHPYLHEFIEMNVNGEFPIKVCTIVQKNTINGIVSSTVHRLSVCLPSFEYSTQLSNGTYFYGNNLEELKEIAEKQLTKTYMILNSAKK